MPDELIMVMLTPDELSVIDCALTDRRFAIVAALVEHPGSVTAHDRTWAAIEERLVDQVAAVLHAAAAAPAPSRRALRAARRAAQLAAATRRYSGPVLPPEAEVL